MGLFSKSPAEKKLKELTGGIFLSSQFIRKLEAKGLTSSDGNKIRDILKTEVKSGMINANDIEKRMNDLINQKAGNFKDDSNERKVCPVCNTKVFKSDRYCTNCRYDFIEKRATKTKECPICFKVIPEISDVCPNCSADLTKSHNTNVSHSVTRATQVCPNCEREVDKGIERCPHCDFLLDDLIQNSGPVHKLLDKKRRVAFLYNQKHNIKICPDCETELLADDDYCYGCGRSFTGKAKVKEAVSEKKTGDDELSDLEKLYTKNVQNKYSTNFKFAYVKYLDAFSKNASQKTLERIARLYDTTPSKLMRQAKEDKYIDLAPPINGANELKVSDLKDILKAHDLKVSGKKDELIQRIGENLDEAELKRLFPKKTYQITDEAKEFLYRNNYILFLNDNRDIGNCFNPQEVESSVEDRHYDENELCDIFGKLLRSKLDYVISNGIWVDYKTYLRGLISVYEISPDHDSALDCHFKIFLYDLNNYSYTRNEAYPQTTSLPSKTVDPLIELLHAMSLSIDELKKQFEDSYNEVSHEMVIPLNDALVYLLRAFNGEDLDTINTEINKIYSNPY